MKIAVTASSGSLGKAVVKRLIRDVGAENVIGIARTPEKASDLGIEIRKGDYEYQSEFVEAFSDVDVALLISSRAEPERRILQHRNVIAAAKTAGVKKLVYTSIIGDETKTSFGPIVYGNRETEKILKDSGLVWAIGRNGLYIEPDLEYVEKYAESGEIANSAGDGKCSYTSREELAVAYSDLLRKRETDGETYNLVGESITQTELAELINKNFGANLKYKSVPVEEFSKSRREELGEILGTIIGGIYESIRNGSFDVPSDYEKVAEKKHKSADEMIKSFLAEKKS